MAKHETPEDPSREIERLRRRLTQLEALISEGRTDQEASWMREASLRTLLDATDDSIALVARDGTLLRINPAGARRLGGDPQELTGRNLYALLPQDLVASRRERLGGVFSSGAPVHFEEQHASRTQLVSAYPVFDDEAVICVAVYGRDITARKRAERRLEGRMTELTRAGRHRQHARAAAPGAWAAR
jgi:PAS domain S-box-containing protein